MHPANHEVIKMRFTSEAERSEYVKAYTNIINGTQLLDILADLGHMELEEIQPLRVSIYCYF